MNNTEPLGDWIDVCPWRSRLVLLLLEDGSLLRQATTLTDKRMALGYNGGNLYAFWPGQWSSSVRLIEQSDREKVLRALS